MWYEISYRMCFGLEALRGNWTEVLLIYQIPGITCFPSFWKIKYNYVQSLEPERELQENELVIQLFVFFNKPDLNFSFEDPSAAKSTYDVQTGKTVIISTNRATKSYSRESEQSQIYYVAVSGSGAKHVKSPISNICLLFRDGFIPCNNFFVCAGVDRDGSI